MNSDVGKRIRALREKKGISQEELAKASGYKDARVIAAIENGTRYPSFGKYKDIANALGVKISEIRSGTKSSIYDDIAALLDEDGKKDLDDFLEEVLDGLRAGHSIEACLEEDLMSDNWFSALEAAAEEKNNAHPKVGEGTYVIEPTAGKEKASAVVCGNGRGRVFDVGFCPEGLTRNEAILKTLDMCLTYIREKGDASEIRIYGVSEYIVKGINSWARMWQENNWKKKDGEPVLHREYWEKILDAKNDVKIRAYLEKVDENE